MDIGSILIIFSVIFIAVMFIGKPLYERGAASVTEQEQAIATLVAEQDRLLSMLEELDFDHKLGKITDEYYPAQRAILLKKIAAILKTLDEQHAELPATQAPDVEAAIEARRAANDGATQRQAVAQDDDIETLIAARRREKKNAPAGFCSQCGHATQKTDKFCANCGETL